MQKSDLVCQNSDKMSPGATNANYDHITHAAKRRSRTTTTHETDTAMRKFIKFCARGSFRVVVVVDTTKMRTCHTQKIQ